MPKETIHGDSMPIDVEIAWGAGSEYVQVASVHDEGARSMIAIVNEWLEAAGMNVIDYPMLQVKLTGTQFEGSPAVFGGWHATLNDRAKVNRMIAVLRRARDHAFGKDE
jgi:hypothetical protein